MELVKSHWVADQNRVHLSVPFAKIDQANRLVSGFATLDNVDTSDDVVTAEASRMAFDQGRRNVREMHQPIAAGRVVDFKEESFFDKEGNLYNGIYVTTHVSEGAESTWLKVLDGTLTGFSIGGNIKQQETQWVPDLGKSVRYITEYDLVELSLVDNPANQFANIFSIVKSNEGSFMKGMVADTKILNVFWCPVDEIAKNSENESEICLSCGTQMQEIGFIEQDGDVALKTATAVANFLRNKEDEATTNNADRNGEGGVQMSEIKKDAEVESEVVAEEVDPAEVTETVEEAPVEEVVATEEVVEAEVEPDFEKMFDGLRDSVNEAVEKSKVAVEEAVDSVEKRIAEVSEAFDAKASELEKSLGELSESLNSIKTERADVSKRLDALEKSTAIKKSGEVETAPEKKVQKGLWSGTFLGDE